MTLISENRTLEEIAKPQSIQLKLQLQGEEIEEDSNPKEQEKIETASWGRIVSDIETCNPDGLQVLYATFGKGVRFLIARQLGYQDIEDHVNDVFLATITAIQKKQLNNPEALPGFIRTLVRRKIAQQISKASWKRNKEVDDDLDTLTQSKFKNPEEEASAAQQVRIMQAVLLELHPKDREILRRFYLEQESAESICATMNLSETQFRLIKSRAKARFAEYGRRKLAKRTFYPFSERKSCIA